MSPLLVGAVGVGAPASATETGPGVGAGRNITVLHNIDMVAVFGFGAVGDVVTVEVIRGGVSFGTATGPLVDSVDGPALEVNHGPEGAPAPGDCWDGTTPDIRPNDRIVVRHAAGVDEVTVDDLRFTEGPSEAANGDVIVHGIAKRFNGTVIAPSLLDAGEFRDSTGKYRTLPNVVEARPGVEGGFTVRYQSPYLLEGRNRNNLTEAQRKAALLDFAEGHAIGFGHTEPPPGDTQMVEGVADASGPALGCEGSPAGPPPGPQPGAALLVASPTSVNFGDVVNGTTSAGRTVTVTNSGTASATSIATSVTAGFARTTNCTATLAVNASCTVTVTATPTATGLVNGTLAITSSANNLSVPLSVNGTASPQPQPQVGEITVNRTALSFGRLRPGTSTTRRVSVTNEGPGVLGIGVTMTGTSFSLASNGCGASLLANRSCTITVRFSAALPSGSKTGALTITSTDSNEGTTTVALRGSVRRR